MTTTARYRYLLTDLKTGQELADLALTGVSFDRRISRPGSLKGNMPILSRESAQQARQLAYMAGRSAIWAYRNNRLWWGGIVWTCQPDQNARGGDSLAFQAATFDSYLHHRYIWDDLTYTDYNQSLLMWDLWAKAQAADYGNLGVIKGDTPNTGILRTRTYVGTDDRTYGKAIEELGDAIDGPEHTLDIADLGGGSRQVSFRTGDPHLSTGRPMISISGSKIPSFGETIDATAAGTHFRARGDSLPDEDVAQVSAVQPATSLLQAGWPRLDVATDHNGITSTTELNQLAQGERSRRAGQSRSSTYEIYLDNNDEWHPNRIGDYVRVIRSRNDWWMESGAEVVRPAVLNITPSDRGKPESIKITIDGDAED